MAKHFKTPEGGVRVASQRAALSPCPRSPRRRTVAAGMTSRTSLRPVPPLVAPSATLRLPAPRPSPRRPGEGLFPSPDGPKWVASGFLWFGGGFRGTIFLVAQRHGIARERSNLALRG